MYKRQVTALSGLQLSQCYGSFRVTALSGYSSVRAELCPDYRTFLVTTRSGLQFGPFYSLVRLELGRGYNSVRVTALSVLQLCPDYSSVRVFAQYGVTARSWLQLGPVTDRSGLQQFSWLKARLLQGAVYRRQQCRTVHLLHCL